MTSQLGTSAPIATQAECIEATDAHSAWSDDGSLTLILAQSLLDNAGVYTPADAAAKMVAWLYRGYLSSTAHAWDEGNATATALGIWAATLDGAGGPVLGDNDVSTGLARVQSALGFERFSGNGSLMRVAPIGLLFWDRSDEARRVAAAQSGLTHPFVVNGEACALYVEVLGGIMRGKGFEVLLELDRGLMSTTDAQSRRIKVTTRHAGAKCERKG